MSRGLTFMNLMLLSLLFSILLNGADYELDKSSALAKKEHKHLMLFLHKNYCGYCENMFLHLDDEDISSVIKKDFILLDINRDEEDETVSYQDYKGTNREFLKKLGVDFYPAMIFINGENKIIFDVSGHRKPHKIMTILNYISTKSYENNMSLEEFRDEEAFEKEDDE